MLAASREGFLAGGCDCDCDCDCDCGLDALFERFFLGAVFGFFGFGGATMVQVKPSKVELLATASQMRLRLDTRAEVGVSVSVMAPGRGVFIASVWGVARAAGCGVLATVATEGRAIEGVVGVGGEGAVVASGCGVQCVACSDAPRRAMVAVAVAGGRPAWAWAWARWANQKQHQGQGGGLKIGRPTLPIQQRPRRRAGQSTSYSARRIHLVS